jgi:hypothetical protein
MLAITSSSPSLVPQLLHAVEQTIRQFFIYRPDGFTVRCHMHWVIWPLNHPIVERLSCVIRMPSIRA